MEAEYQKALEIVTQRPVLAADLDSDVLTDIVCEFHAGEYFLGYPADQDTAAFMFAVVGLKMLAGCECNFDRSASARLLRAAADEIERHQFMDQPARIMALDAGDEVKVILVRYMPAGPALSTLLGKVKWSCFLKWVWENSTKTSSARRRPISGKRTQRL